MSDHRSAQILRTFQRGVEVCSALNAPPKEVLFPEAHERVRAAQFVYLEGRATDYFRGSVCRCPTWRVRLVG